MTPLRLTPMQAATIASIAKRSHTWDEVPGVDVHPPDAEQVVRVQTLERDYYVDHAGSVDVISVAP